MTRDNHTQSSLALPNEDTIINLPDLSDFQPAEKEHILKVLTRDENLRNKHLSRFMNLRKEVSDLEQQPAPTSSSVCARCQTRFGILFNTGDACPKCGANVCQQCRLMHDVNDDNGWLCKLCCKQMQLLSYSGEWIYAIHSNLRKASITKSEMPDEPLPLPPSSSNNNMNGNGNDNGNDHANGIESSSDSEVDELLAATVKVNRFTTNKPTVANPIAQKRKDKADTMIVQNTLDEQKLNYVRDRIKDRPLHSTYTQPLPRRTRQLASSTGTPFKNSSNDINSISNQSNRHGSQTSVKPNQPNRHGSQISVKPNQPNKHGSQISVKSNLPLPKSVDTLKVKEKQFDTMSITSSEYGGGGDDDDDDIDRSEVDKPKIIIQDEKEKGRRRTSQSSTRNSKLSIASVETTKSNHKHISASIQSLRNAVHRIPHPHISSSRTSLTAEKEPKSERANSSTINDEDIIPSKVKDVSSRTNSRTNLTSPQSSVIESKQNLPTKKRHESASTTISTNKNESQVSQRHVSESDSIKTSVTDYSRQDSRPESIGYRSSVGDSEDDIDRKFETAKSGSTKRSSSFKDLRGSHLSLTSLMSEAKARYDLEITGTIELKLGYNKLTGAFDIYIKQCMHLAGAKRNHTSNPYCKIYLLPDKSKGSKRKTSVQKGTTSPVFDEALRYHLTLQEFSVRTLWISVWSESALGHNDFLGEVHIPLADCKLDQLEEFTLLPRAKQEGEEEEVEAAPIAEQPAEASRLCFELTFLENTKNNNIGTIQVNNIQAKGVRHAKANADGICKGLLMPDKIKRKLPTTRKGPSPKWDIPLRWEGIHLKHLSKISLEISIWSQERFRKTMLGYVRLNLTRLPTDSREMKALAATEGEKQCWDGFQKNPTKIHYVDLPLRPATHPQK